MNILSMQVLTVCQKIGEDFSALGFSVSWAGRFWLETELGTTESREVLALISSPNSRVVDWQLPEKRVSITQWHVDWHAAWVVRLREHFAKLHYLLEPMANGFRLSELNFLVNFWLEDGQICFVGLDKDTRFEENTDNLNTHQLEIQLIRLI